MDLDFCFNLESEMKFLSLFDYHIKTFGNSNHWVIVDALNNYKGFIRKEQYCVSEGITVDAYHMKFNDRLMSCDNTRLSADKDFTYSFKYHYCPTDDVNVFVNLGSRPKLVVSNDRTRIGHLEVDNRSVNLGFRMFTSTHLITQNMLYQDSDDRFNDARGRKAYVYKMVYVPTSGPIMGQKFCQQCAVSEDLNGSTYFMNSVQNPDLVSNTHEVIKVDGTVEDALEQHGDGLNALKYFKNVIEKYYPFRKDIVSIILKSSEIGEELNQMAVDHKFIMK